MTTTEARTDRDIHPRRESWRWAMNDVLYLGITLMFFGLTWALVRLCERL